MIALLQEWLEVLGPHTDLHEDIALTVQHMAEELNDLLVDKAEYDREAAFDREYVSDTPSDWNKLVNSQRSNYRNLK